MTLRGAKELDRRLDALRDGTATKELLGQFGLMAVRFAKDEVPRKTGNLGRTIRLGSIDVRRQSVRIVAGGTRKVGYAAYVEFGTKGGQIIVPKRGKVLAWGGSRRLSGNLRSGSGATNFARRVKRGATRAKPYLVPGARKALREVDKAKAIIDTWDRAA